MNSRSAFKLMVATATFFTAGGSLLALDVPSSADAYVRSGSFQNSNFGTATSLAIKKSASPTDDFNREIYLKFDLSEVTSIRSAKLQLHGSSSTPEIVAVDLYSAATTSWSEGGITWANRPATGPIMWSTLAVQNAPAWHTWDITRYLQGEKTMGRNVVTLVLRASVASTTGNIGFNSREASSNRPKLVITEAFPWMYHEAEDGTLENGATIQASTSWGDVAFEARGRKAALLNAQNEGVRWTAKKAADRATVRYSIPDGQTGTLQLFVNSESQPRAEFALNSLRMRETKTNGDGPSSDIVRYYDDVMMPVGTIAKNDVVRVRKKEANSVAIHLDFLELEDAPNTAPGKPDSSWVAVALNTGDDRQAIVDAIATANSGSKKVWIPAGSYTIAAPPSGDIAIPVPGGITIKGAGIWHTTLTKNFGGTNKRVFQLTGNNVTLQDFKCIDTITTLSGNSQNVVVRPNDNTSGHVVERIWAEYASLFLGFNVSNVTVRDNRIRNAYKDTIHFAKNSTNNLVERNAIRNAGDDNVAFIAYDQDGMADNLAQYNVAECAYWGRGLSIGGGDGNILRYNLANDCSRAGLLVTVENFNTQITHFCTNFAVERNVVVRCGNAITGSGHPTTGAVSVFGHVNEEMQGKVDYNLILGSAHHALRADGYVGDAGTSNVVYARYNGIEQPAAGNRVHTALLTDNTVSPPGQPNFVASSNHDL